MRPRDGRKSLTGSSAAIRHSSAEPRELHILLPVAEPLAGGDAELLGDEVGAGHQLRDGMLHLEPGVHLQEVELPRLVEQELHRAGVA